MMMVYLPMNGIQMTMEDFTRVPLQLLALIFYLLGLIKLLLGQKIMQAIGHTLFMVELLY